MTSTEAYHELLEEILNGLEESVQENDWDAIDNVMHQIREAIDNPYDNYNTEDWQRLWGCNGNRQVLFENRVQQRLSMSRNKRLTTLYGEDIDLAGLDIDWHLAEYDYSVELPVGDSQPSYAYAA